MCCGALLCHLTRADCQAWAWMCTEVRESESGAGRAEGRLRGAVLVGWVSRVLGRLAARLHEHRRRLDMRLAVVLEPAAHSTTWLSGV